MWVAAIFLLQWTILVLARPSALPPIETITLKCQPNTQGYPITLEMAKKSHFLKSSTSEVVVLGTSDCEKGLPIIVKVLNGGILTMTRENFGYIFPLASQLDILLHKECIRFFLDHSDLIHEIKDQNARDELETLLTVREKLESLGYNDWKRDLMDVGELRLDIKIEKGLINVEWLTNALNSGSLRHLKVLYVNRQKISKFSLLPKHPLSLKKLGLDNNRISDVDELVHALNEGYLPHLEELSMLSNKIRHFPIAPKQPLNMKYLSLAENRISKSQFFITALNGGMLPDLETLILDKNRITTFNLALSNPSKIKKLSIESNKLKNVDSIVEALNEGKLPMLETLSLSANWISNFPVAPSQPLNIKRLTLDDNALINIPSLVTSINQGLLPNLETLTLDTNDIQLFPLLPRQNLKLRMLSIGSNRINTANLLFQALDVGRLPELEFLYLNNNRITEIPFSSKKTLTNALKQLILNGNQISNIHPLILALNSGKFENLEYLDLAQNPIISWNAWGLLTRTIPELQNLDFDFKEIRALDDIEPFIFAYNKRLLPMLSHSDIDKALKSYELQLKAVIDLEIKRKDIYGSSKKYFSFHGDSDWKQIRIQFKGEIMQESGRAIRNFVHHLSKEMVKPAHGIFQVIAREIVNEEDTRATPLYYFSEYDECKKDDYQFIGMFLAIAYLKKATLSIEFAPIFYSLLIHSDMPLQFEDLRGYDVGLYEKLKNTKDKPDMLSQLHFCIDRNPISENYGCDVQVTIENQKDYFNAFANYIMKKRYEKTIHAISKEFRYYFTKFQMPVTIEKLMKTLIPTAYISVSELIAHTEFKGFTPEEAVKMKTFYSEILNEWDQTNEGQKHIESLVIFIRGGKLPITGWMEVPNIILQKEASNLSPISRQCYASVNIPFYSTKDALFNGLYQALLIFKATNGIAKNL